MKLRYLALVVVILAVAAAGFVVGRARPATTADPALYHAVLLSNGSVYFGHLEGLDKAYPVLRDVYYVQSSVDQQTKAVTNILVKRGKEWHAPDRMLLQASSIVFLEPVNPNSRVAQLIAESRR